MTRNSFFIGAAALLVLPVIAQARSTAPTTTAPADQAATAPAAAAAPADPAPAPAAAAASDATAAAPATASAADTVTKEGGKYMKGGRKATKSEIAEYKKAEKTKHE